uniref:Enhancer of mRNA-decapping protein 4 n=1 Tax=Sander lucioperca TaxID=283035 RepID=A0A8D0DF93_SANLU
MASNSNMDIEGATQHLRDILKLDRPGNSTGDGLRMPSFNGELNGLLGAAGLLGSTDRSTMSNSTRPISTDLSSAQDCLSGDDGSTCIPITSNNVEIVASQDSSINSKARGSNKVKIQPVAKYDWEHKYYYGRLIAVSNSFLAYAIRGANNHAMIRVLSVGFAERSLLKGFTGAVTDLAFAHLDSSLLGCVDEAGNLMVWQITCTGNKILDQVVVHIRRPEDSPLNSHRRLIWCPFIQDENEENQDDTSQTLALLHEDMAEVWDLEVLRANNSSWPVDATDLKEGLITIKGHNQRVSEGALSPDGTVLATASHDGYIKFWQIYIEGVQDKPRCLHELRPHGGRPLSCLLFCDNHKRQDPEVPFWRFLITGADQNQELKMWCTVSWTCLQTIRFSPDLFNSSVLPSLKASLDLSAQYLILTDVQRKVLYVMELRQDLEKGKASFTAVSEFLLTHPVLSFGVRDVTHSRLRHTEVLPAEEESESMTTGVHVSLTFVFLCHCVFFRSLQDVQIWFQPNLGSSSTIFLPHSDSQDGFGNSDKDSGSGSQTDLRKIPSLPAPTDFLSNSGASSGTKLMTPDAFMTPSTSVPTLATIDDVSQSPNRAENNGSSSSSSSSLALSNSTSSPRASSVVLMPGLENLQVRPDTLPQVLDSPLLPPLASPTRARSPDVISSASTAMSQDMPEIASQTLQLQRGLVSSLEPLPLSALQTDSMASAASALHLLTSPRTANNNRYIDEKQQQPSREELKDRHLSSPYHRRSYHLTQNDSQDAGAEQSDPDDEVASLASSSGKSGSRSSHRLPVKDWKTSPRGSPKVKRKTKKDDRYDDMNAEVQDELLMLLRSQQRELTELRGQIEAMQSTIMAQVEHVLTNHQEQEQRRLERVLSESQNHQQQLQEQLSQQLSHTLSSVLTNRMDKVIREEMKKTVPQSISKSLEPVTGQLSNTIAAKLTAVEVSGWTCIPGCQSMFQQINDSFKQGTQEYIQQLETHMKNRKQKEQETRDPMIGQLQQMTDSFQSSTDQLANNITANVRAEVQHQIQMMVGNLQESILSHVQRIVKGEVSQAMKEQQAVVTSSIMQAMRSAASTPVPTAHLDYQTQQANILQLLQQGQLNQAFQQALSATDLNLVLYVCETIDSQQVFGQHPCPLSQPVLLSLIQQLSSNLTTRSELKISYLEDAVMNLDHSDPLTRDHMSSVLAQVRPKLFAFLQQDPHSPLSKRARRLMMMLQGLVSH